MAGTDYFADALLSLFSFLICSLMAKWFAFIGSSLYIVPSKKMVCQNESMI